MLLRSKIRPSASALLRQGFTLIELMAVILIISILTVFLLPMVTDGIAGAEVTACESNLQKIGQAITQYRTKYERLPRESGVRYFAELYSKQAMENTVTNAKRLTCPAVDKGALDIADLDWSEWWSDLDSITGNYSAYAGRDNKRFGVRRLTGTEPLVADDNDPDMNHPTTTNVLYGDLSVQSFELIDLRDDGTLADDEILLVGPSSQVNDLRKLSLD